MSSGHLEDEHTQRVVRSLEQRDFPWGSIHTSEHAATKDLRPFAEALPPSTLGPIHSFETGRFAEFFDNVAQRQARVWRQVWG